MKIRSILVLLCCLGVIAPTWAKKANKEEESLKLFEKWASAKVMCQNYPYHTEITNKKFARNARRVGMEVNTKRSKKGILSGTIVPKKPIQLVIHGVPVESMRFEVNTDGHFYALVKATPQDLFSAIEKRNLEQYQLSGVTTDDKLLYAFLTSRATSYAPFGQEARAVVIRRSDVEGMLEIGCQQYNVPVAQYREILESE